MCELRPPVTLWGTTQIKTVTTVLSTIAPNEVSTITRDTIITNVIPVETRSYPCTSTSSPSPTPTPTPSPSPEPQPQPQPESSSQSPEPSSQAVSEQPITSRPQLSPSPSPSVDEEPTFKLTEEVTDPSDTSTPSRALVRTSTTTRQPSITLETSEPPSEATTDPLATIGESDPIISASSLFTEPDGSATTAGAALSSSSNESNPLPVGAIVGIILGILLILTLLGFFIWTRKNRRDRDSEGDGDPYWERRFQELESVQSQSKARLESSTQSPSNEGTWRRHVSPLSCGGYILMDKLTLNLGSHHPVINRPASRLSQISSFFGQNQSQSSPPPSRLGLINESSRERDEIDFSQPADRWSLLTRTPTPARPASTRSKRSQIASRKSNSVKSSSGSGVSGRRSSAWPFGAIAAAMRPRVEGGTRTGLEGRRGMEWIKTIVSSDSGFGFNMDPRDRDRDQSSRGLPPPPRRGVSPMPPPVARTTDDVNTHQGSSDEEDVQSPNPISPNPPPSYFTQSHFQSQYSEEDTQSTLAGKSRQLVPSSSLRRKRVNKGLAVPDLALARDAVSPNLWVDEDTLDRNGNDIPTTAALLQMPSVAPLAIAKRNQNPLPPLPQMAKTGPSAYNPDLTSRFSPDSSRGSFTTDGRQSVPAPPQTGRTVEDPAHTRALQRETDGDSIATRRYDRSAVTPQLPTLSFSGDAFKQEMAEISASTGEDREERVISFHGGRDRDRG